MIARRQGFPKLQELFTGKYASQKAQEDYEKGEHFLLKPFVTSLNPLIDAYRKNDIKALFSSLRYNSPAFDPKGVNAERTLGEMKKLAFDLMEELDQLWKNSTLGEILRFSVKNSLCRASERLQESISRTPRQEEYDEELYAEEKGDWLVDDFLGMTSVEIPLFVEFIQENTPYSTQHGVKGEEYKDVVVVFDDVEAAWNKFSFAKTLTPQTTGQPTEKQYDRSIKLSYVCFSRVEDNLRILLYTQNPNSAKVELIKYGLFQEEQITIVD